MNHQLEIISDFCRGSVCCCHFSKPADGEEKRRTCSVSFMLIYSLLSLTFRLHVLLYLIIPLLPVNTHSHTHSHTALSCFSPHTTSPPQPPHMLFDKWMVSPHQAHDNVHRWEVETGTRASSKHAHRAKSSTYVAVIQTAMLTDTSRRSGSMAKQEGLFFWAAIKEKISDLLICLLLCAVNGAADCTSISEEETDRWTVKSNITRLFCLILFWYF